MPSQFPIKYIDASGLSLYALVFKDDNTCYSSGNGFITFNGNYHVSNHPIYLNESRYGFYQITPDHSSFNVNQEFRVEIYQYSVTGLYGTDPVKAIASVIWNKQADIGYFRTPFIDAPDSLGEFNNAAPLNYRTRIFDKFGKAGNNVSGLNYHILRQNNTVIVTGFMLPTGIEDDYFYNFNISSLTPSIYNSGSYVVRVSGLYAESGKTPYQLGAESQFTIRPDNTVLNIDVAGQLGYASGTITEETPSSSGFITSLTSSTTSAYCGQIIRFLGSGNLIGQGRIINGYNGALKRITVNKPFSEAPVQFQGFVIYPLGGELGL